MMPKKNKNPMPVLPDRGIVSKVQQYLEENVDKTFVDVSVMAKELQMRWPEYQRRKMIPFRQLVEAAYKTVVHSYGLDTNSSNGEDESDVEAIFENPNRMEDTMNNLYGANKTASNEIDDPIDISSDDENTKEKELVTNVDIPLKTIPALATSLSTNSNNEPIPSENPINPKAKSRKRAYEEISNEKISPPAPKLALKQKKYKKDIVPKSIKVTFANVGGITKTLEELCDLILHIKHPEVYQHLGIAPSRGILLHGPPGSGKTLLAHAIAGQLGIPLIEILATELVTGVSGESEERIRDVFEQAVNLAPCVLFLDEIDSISSNRINASKDMERRIVAQLASCLDGLGTLVNGNKVLVIGATNRVDSLDPAIRRFGRFDQEILLGIPDRAARKEILEVICKNLNVENIDYSELASLTPGYVGADLSALATRAALAAVKRIFMHKENEFVNSQFDKVRELQNHIVVNGGNPKPIETVPEEEVKMGEEEILMTVDVVKETENVEKQVSEEVNVGVEAPEVEKMETDENFPVVSELKKKLNSEATSAENNVELSQDLKSQNSQVSNNVTESMKNHRMFEKRGEALLEESSQIPSYSMNLAEKLAWLTGVNPSLNSSEIQNFKITLSDFKQALKQVQPSAKREGFVTVPNVTWEDIGSLKDIREELKLAILAPVKHPEYLKLLGLSAPSGVLLCGPPGCGKTLLAKAVANEAGINFISVKGPELLNMYVGESERAVRQCFQRAKNSAPCVIFFDEFDALCPKRSDTNDSSASMRVVNQLLTEMDGVEERYGVFLMAATNRPDIVDPAVLRPGRFDKILFVGLPNRFDRIDIIQKVTKGGTKPPLAEDIEINELADLTDGFSGADLAGLVRQAGLLALKSSLSAPSENSKKVQVTRQNILDALKSVKPSVSTQEQLHYKDLEDKYGVK